MEAVVLAYRSIVAVDEDVVGVLVGRTPEQLPRVDVLDPSVLGRLVDHHLADDAERGVLRWVARHRRTDPDELAPVLGEQVHHGRHSLGILVGPAGVGGVLDRLAARQDQTLAVVATELHDDDVRVQAGDVVAELGRPVERVGPGEAGTDLHPTLGDGHLRAGHQGHQLQRQIAGQRIASDVDLGGFGPGRNMRPGGDVGDARDGVDGRRVRRDGRVGGGRSVTRRSRGRRRRHGTGRRRAAGRIGGCAVAGVAAILVEGVRRTVDAERMGDLLQRPGHRHRRVAQRRTDRQPAGPRREPVGVEQRGQQQGDGADHHDVERRECSRSRPVARARGRSRSRVRAGTRPT